MMSEDSNAAGTDNRPPMLEESDYESWKIRIERYIKGKTHGKLIWKSILNGPSAHPQITNPVPTGSPAGIVMQPRDKRHEEFTDAKNLKELYDIQASNILSQEHALKKLKKQEQSSSVVDPLAYLVKTTNQQDKAMLLQAKENGAVLDAEAAAFLADVECTVPLAEPLALTTTNMFQVNHEDAYDSDVDDEPNAAAAFMANLSSISSHINEVRTFNDNIFETVSPSWPSEYLATKESQDVPTEASPIPPTVAYMLQTLTDLTTQVKGHR
nr:hypothetical protein [Tanacetum cinerariifolium]